MCEFCKPEKIGNGKEIVNQIAVEPIAMGDYEDVLQLETWILTNEKGENPKLQIILAIAHGSDEIKKMDIPIKYCPKCGREL